MFKTDQIYIFPGEGPGLGQDPGLPVYGFKIQDRTVDVCIPMGHRVKLQISSCGSRKIGDRQTES
jgi:hypothetical protein